MFSESDVSDIRSCGETRFTYPENDCPLVHEPASLLGVMVTDRKPATDEAKSQASTDWTPNHRPKEHLKMAHGYGQTTRVE